MRLTTGWILLATLVHCTSAHLPGGLRRRGGLTNELGSMVLPESGSLPFRELKHHYKYHSEEVVEEEMEKAVGSKQHHKEEDGKMAEHAAKAHKAKETTHYSKSKSSKSKASKSKQKHPEFPYDDYEMSMSMPIKPKSSKGKGKDHEMPIDYYDMSMSMPIKSEKKKGGPKRPKAPHVPSPSPPKGSKSPKVKSEKEKGSPKSPPTIHPPAPTSTKAPKIPKTPTPEKKKQPQKKSKSSKSGKGVEKKSMDKTHKDKDDKKDASKKNGKESSANKSGKGSSGTKGGKEKNSKDTGSKGKDKGHKESGPKKSTKVKGEKDANSKKGGKGKDKNDKDTTSKGGKDKKDKNPGSKKNGKDHGKDHDDDNDEDDVAKNGSNLDVESAVLTLPVAAFEYTTSSRALAAEKDYKELAEVTTHIFNSIYEWFYEDIKGVDYILTEIPKYNILGPRLVKFQVMVHFRPPTRFRSLSEVEIPRRVPPVSEMDTVAASKLASGADFYNVYLNNLKALESEVFKTTTAVRFINDANELERAQAKANGDNESTWWEDNVVKIVVPIATFLAAMILCFCFCRYCRSRRRSLTMQEIEELEAKVARNRDPENGSTGGESTTIASDFRASVFSEDGVEKCRNRLERQSACREDHDDKTLEAELEEVMSGLDGLEEVSLEDDDMYIRQEDPMGIKESGYNAEPRKVVSFAAPGDVNGERVKSDPEAKRIEEAMSEAARIDETKDTDVCTIDVSAIVQVLNKSTTWQTAEPATEQADKQSQNDSAVAFDSDAKIEKTTESGSQSFPSESRESPTLPVSALVQALNKSTCSQTAEKASTPSDKQCQIDNPVVFSNMTSNSKNSPSQTLDSAALPENKQQSLSTPVPSKPAEFAMSRGAITGSSVFKPEKILKPVEYTIKDDSSDDKSGEAANTTKFVPTKSAKTERSKEVTFISSPPKAAENETSSKATIKDASSVSPEIVKPVKASVKSTLSEASEVKPNPSQHADEASVPANQQQSPATATPSKADEDVENTEAEEQVMAPDSSDKVEPSDELPKPEWMTKLLRPTAEAPKPVPSSAQSSPEDQSDASPEWMQKFKQMGLQKES